MEIDRMTTIVKVDGLAFPVIDHGDGPAVLLLHGFPDSRYLWRHQIQALTDAGLRVIAPDLPGFGDAPKPQTVEDYRITAVMKKVIGILDALGIERVRIVGHDWGAVVAWYLAMYYPHRIERLVALSAGCPGNPGRETIEQRERFWYELFFQFKDIAEAWLRHDDWKLFREWSRDAGDNERYLTDLSRPGALTAALNWYRANSAPSKPSNKRGELPTVTCPVLGIWSDGDKYLAESHVTGSAKVVGGAWRYERIEGASHWMMLDVPEVINTLLVEFLTE